MNLTPEEYKKVSQKYSRNSPLLKDCTMAFLIGGLICCIGQALTTLYMYWGLEQEVASAVTSVSLVFLSALLTGFNVYDNIAKFAGAGTLGPITGFANAVVSPALEFKSEGFVLGVGAKLFVIAGPVLVYGLSSGIVVGIIAFLFQLL